MLVCYQCVPLIVKPMMCLVTLRFNASNFLHSIQNSYRQTDRQTDGRMDRRTDRQVTLLDNYFLPPNVVPTLKLM